MFAGIIHSWVTCMGPQSQYKIVVTSWGKHFKQVEHWNLPSQCIFLVPWNTLIHSACLRLKHSLLTKYRWTIETTALTAERLTAVSNWRRKNGCILWIQNHKFSVSVKIRQYFWGKFGRLDTEFLVQVFDNADEIDGREISVQGSSKRFQKKSECEKWKKHL